MVLNCFHSPLVFVSFLILQLIPFIGGEWVPRSVTPLDQSYTAVTWPSDGTAVAVSAKAAGYIIRSTDYGLTWSQVSTSFSISSMYCLTSISIRSVSYMYTADDGGGIYGSVDEGVSWKKLSTKAAALYSVAIGSNGNLFVGASTIVFTSSISANGTWSSNSLPGTNQGTVYGLATLDGTNAIAVTSTGRAYFSSKNGTSWTSSGRLFTSAGQQFNNAGGTNVPFYCVTMGNATVAYAAGGSGIMYKSFTTGRSWYQLTSPISGSDIKYKAISTLDANKVYIVGNNGRMYASYDGGYTWSLQVNIGTTSTGLQSIAMLSSTKGVAGGSSGFGMYTLAPGKSINRLHFQYLCF